MNADDAQHRRLIALPDGRTGRLLYWPIPPHQRRQGSRPRRGAKTRVLLPSGAVITVPTDQVRPAEGAA